MNKRPEYSDIIAAAKEISRVAEQTPLVFSYPLSEMFDAEIHLKLENLMFPVNSFKLRGAYNRMRLLTDDEKKNGVVAVSAGNHSQAVAYCAALLDVHATIFMPENAPEIKVKKTRAFGAEVVLKGKDYDDSERYSHEFEKETGRVFIHPFYDEMIIAGQGTVALEILEKQPDIETMIVPVGGGGLITGCAIAAAGAGSNAEIIGVQPDASAPFKHSLAAGSYVETPILDSIADALTGDIISEQFFEFFSENVKTVVSVSEEEIREAIYWLLKNHAMAIEGGAAVGIAAMMKGRIAVKGKKVAVVITGSGIDVKKLSGIMSEFEE